MIEFRLRLVPTESRQREPSGWFVAGADPSVWLEAIASWGVPLGRAELRIVARGERDPRPAGVLVVPGAGDRWTVSDLQAEPWACLAGKLWIPCNARLDPPITDAEIAALPGTPALLHPGGGLAAFVPGDVRTVADLLEPPTERTADWSRAKPGATRAPRLIAAEPESPPRIELLLREGGGDISSQPPDSIPGGGQMSLLEQALKRAGLGLAEALHWLSRIGEIPPDKPGSKPKTRAPGTTPSGPGWLDRLKSWSAEKIAKFAADLQSAREKEVNRLLRLLDKDPDLGLRFALPLGGAGTRGIAPPSSALGPRSVDFNLNRLGGGSASDAWALDWKTQQALQHRYRELALRELRLGRHRRAAYIFAELLGDFRAAADALIEGRHFREAAILYRDKLKQPLQAAACLEKGGLLLEAIPIYEGEGRWETAGDLWAKIERREEAVASWRKASEVARDKGDALAAGRLLEGKLAVPDEALALYASTWPASYQAGPCLEASFELLGRLGRSEAALALVSQRLSSAQRDLTANSRFLLLARAFSATAGTYPDRHVRERAADASRVVAGTRLPVSDPADAQDLLRSLIRVAPNDRLLARDAQRFVQRRRAPLALPAPKARNSAWIPVLSSAFQLPPDIMWETAAARRDGVYVAGFGRGGAVLARAPWSDAVQTLTWIPGINYPHILEPGEAGRPVLFAGSPGPRLDLMTFPKSDAIPEETPAGTPAWFPDDVLGAAVSELGTVWIVREHLSRLVAWAYSQAGAISTIVPLPQLEEALPEGESARALAPLPAVTRRNSLFVALHRRLARLGRDGAVAFADLPLPVTMLAASSRASHDVLVAAFETGAAVVFDTPELSDIRRIADDLPDPLVAFTRDGTLIVISEREGRVFDIEERRVVERATFPVAGGRPISVVTGPGPGEFALVMGTGEVRVMKVKAR